MFEALFKEIIKKHIVLINSFIISGTLFIFILVAFMISQGNLFVGGLLFLCSLFLVGTLAIGVETFTGYLSLLKTAEDSFFSKIFIPFFKSLVIPSIFMGIVMPLPCIPLLAGGSWPSTLIGQIGFCFLIVCYIVFVFTLIRAYSKVSKF